MASVPPHPGGDQPDSPYAWWRLAIALGLATVGGIGLWSVVVALPTIEAEFEIDRGDASVPYAATMIGIAVGGAGILLPATAPAAPSTRNTPRPEAFKSGGERSVVVLRDIEKKLESGNDRSEKVLREIATTLARIDTRLQRLEQAAIKAAAKERSSRTPGSDGR